MVIIRGRLRYYLLKRIKAKIIKFVIKSHFDKLFGREISKIMQKKVAEDKIKDNWQPVLDQFCLGVLRLPLKRSSKRITSIT